MALHSAVIISTKALSGTEARRQVACLRPPGSTDSPGRSLLSTKTFDHDQRQVAPAVSVPCKRRRNHLAGRRGDGVAPSHLVWEKGAGGEAVEGERD